MTIKLWNWDKKWTCQQVFEGHSHYVMQIVINPKDNNTFASASLDRTVKVTIVTFQLHCLMLLIDFFLFFEIFIYFCLFIFLHSNRSLHIHT